MDKSVIVIDGSYLEGGGQILRYATCLGAILQQPVTVNKIRAGRNPAGLRPQHLLGVQLVSNISNSRLTDCQVGSTEVTMWPSNLRGGQYEGDTKTAGSLCLLIQSVLPPLVFTDTPSVVTLKGGTNVDFAPTIDYFLEVLPFYMKKFGVEYSIDLITRGFYPAGGGQVKLHVTPLKLQSKTSGDDGKHYLTPIQLTERGQVSCIRITSHVCGPISPKNGYGMIERLLQLCKQHFPNVKVQHILEKKEDTKSKGVDIIIIAETTTGCRFAASRVCQRNSQPNTLAEEAFSELQNILQTGACCDEYMQDQIILFMALAKGESRVHVGPITDHTKTAMFVLTELTKVRFSIEPCTDLPNTNLMRCEGIAWSC